MSTGTAYVEQWFEPDPASAGSARSFVVSQVAGEIGDAADIFTLAVSEVVTNAILHAATPFRVRVASSDDSVRVEVFDSSPGTPIRKEFEPHAVTGRGLGIVDQIAESWGVTPAQDGKTVWFEMALADPLGATTALDNATYDPDTSDRPDLTLTPAGDLDLQTGPRLRDQLAELLDQGAHQVVVDLEAVTFIDSVGLSVLIVAQQRYLANGVSMSALVPSHLRRTFEIAGVLDLFADPQPTDGTAA